MKKILMTVLVFLLLTSGLVSAATIREDKYRSTHDPAYKPKIVASVSLDPSQVTMADGRIFYHAGYGATFAFDGERLNYTQKGGNSGLIGKFMVDEYGNLFVKYVEFKPSPKEGFVKTRSLILRVQRMDWNFDFLKGD